PVKIVAVYPRFNEGGAYIKFALSDSTNTTTGEIARTITKQLDEEHSRPWFNPFGRIRCFEVMGTPWVEDMRRIPSRTIIMKFSGDPPYLSEEDMYALFRRYGHVNDITPPSKESPNEAKVTFDRLRSALVARNCVHGLKIRNDPDKFFRLNLLFEKSYGAHIIRDSIVNHPRISFPIIIALLAAVTVSIFEPIREFFVCQKISHSMSTLLHSSWFSPIFEWSSQLYTSFLDITHLSSTSDNMTRAWASEWDDRKQAVQLINQWMEDGADSLIVVSGPSGSGKSYMVNEMVLKDRPHVLRINCSKLADTRNSSAFLHALSSQLGYFPVFPWWNSMARFFDLAAQSLIGQKTGLAESVQDYTVSMLNTTARVLKSVALKHYEPSEGLSELKYLENNPEELPVVVIENFLHKSADKSNAMLYDSLAEFASVLAISNCAHVIIVTSDVRYEEVLTPYLPDRMLKSVVIGDADLASARQYLFDLLPESCRTQIDVARADKALGIIGGRVTDLQKLVRRVTRGEDIESAVSEMATQAVMEILKMYLFFGQSVNPSSSTEKVSWNTEQVWALVKYLAVHDTVCYPELLLTRFFKGADGDKALFGLAHARMISIEVENGSPVLIRPGKPLYHEAFKRIVNDDRVSSRMETDSLRAIIKAETANIAKYEDELSLLGKVANTGAKEIGARVSYLNGKIKSSQDCIESSERAI
ncbi:hypothetical protein CANCADRAFT_12896, partial [Tortispora caseinolytica NRRL Y-17796]